jgi:hypothetical protein
MSFQELIYPLIRSIISLADAISDIRNLLVKSGPIINGNGVLNRDILDALFNSVQSLPPPNQNTFFNKLTSDEYSAIRCYTEESTFYKILNFLLRSNDIENLRPFSKYIMLLIRGMLKCPKPGGHNLFRGFTHLEDIRKYPEGKLMCWFQFSSASLNQSITAEFLSNHGTMFTIEKCKNTLARNISGISTNGGEAEALYLPGASFNVISSFLFGGILLNVHMKESNLEQIENFYEEIMRTSATLESTLESSADATLESSVEKIESSIAGVCTISHTLEITLKWKCIYCKYYNVSNSHLCELCAKDKQSTDSSAAVGTDEHASVDVGTDEHASVAIGTGECASVAIGTDEHASAAVGTGECASVDIGTGECANTIYSNKPPKEPKGPKKKKLWMCTSCVFENSNNDTICRICGKKNNFF